jgi:hypothetical protein
MISVSPAITVYLRPPLYISGHHFISPVITVYLRPSLYISGHHRIRIAVYLHCQRIISDSEPPPEPSLSLRVTARLGVVASQPRRDASAAESRRRRRLGRRAGQACLSRIYRGWSVLTRSAACVPPPPLLPPPLGPRRQSHRWTCCRTGYPSRTRGPTRSVQRCCRLQATLQPHRCDNRRWRAGVAAA